MKLGYSISWTSIHRVLGSPVTGLGGFYAVTQMANLGISIVLAHQLRDLLEISHFEQASLVTYFFSFFWLNGFIQAFQIKHRPLQTGQFFSFYLMISGLALGFMVGILLIQRGIGFLMFNQIQIPYIHQFAVFMIFSIPLHVLALWFFHQGNTLSQWLFSVAYSLSRILAFLVPLIMNQSLTTCLWVLCSMTFIWHVGMVILLRRKKEWTWNGDFAKALFSGTISLSAYALLGSLTHLIPAWIINIQLNQHDDFAIYRYGAKEVPLLSGILISLTVAYLPALKKSIPEGLKELKKGTIFLHHLIFPGIILLIWLTPFLFTLLFGPIFIPAGLVFIILTLTTTTRLIFSQTVLMALDKNKLLLVSIIGELTINFIASYILAQRLGLAGLALGTLTGYLFEKLLMIIYLRRYQHISLGDYYPVKLGLIYNSLLWISVVLVWTFYYG